MCRYQTLYLNEKTGYAVQCEECEKIQVAYSNLVMTFERKDFDAFHGWVKKIRNTQPVPECPAVRSIMISSPCQGIQLLLSYHELNEFCDMLETADTELQSLALIKMFDE